MKNLKVAVITSIFALSLGLFSTPANADTTCTTGPYGSTNCTTSVSIDKMVKESTSGDYRDNITDSMTPYSPNSEVWFKLAVKNTSNQDLTNVEVRDELPNMFSSILNLEDLKKNDNYVDVSYNSDRRELTLKIRSLKRDETKEIFVNAKLKDASYFRKTDSKGGVVDSKSCESNLGEAKKDGSTSQDRAQVCVQDKVLGTTTLPTAGPEDWLPVAPFIALAIVGVGLFMKPRTL